MISAGFLHDGVLLWLNLLNKAKETRLNLDLDAIAKEGNHLSELSRDMRMKGWRSLPFLADFNCTLEFI